MTAIYTRDAAGVISGPVTIPVVPGLGHVLPSNAVELPELPPARPGHVWILRDCQAVETPEPRPSSCHVWQGDAWALDEEAQLESLRAAERAWRDARLAATDYLAMPDYPLSESARVELYSYRQALRDWPQSATFPDASGRPVAPECLGGSSSVSKLATGF